MGLSLVNWIIPRMPIQVHPALVPHRITRHKLAELRIVEPVTQQVDEARVLVPSYRS